MLIRGRDKEIPPSELAPGTSRILNLLAHAIFHSPKVKLEKQKHNFIDLKAWHLSSIEAAKS